MQVYKSALTTTERESIERWISAAEGVRATCQNLSAFDELIAVHRARLGTTKGEKMSVTPQYILQGAAYALEQCGLLLRDANLLYRNGAYANAVVLAAFGREELGRYLILLEFWRKACTGGTFTREQLQEACDNHVAKQRAGMLSLTLRAHIDSGVGQVLNARMKNDPQSPEWRKADAALEQIDKTKKKRSPDDRHEARIKALYVEPISDADWNRPSDTTALAAWEFLVDAGNDYSIRYSQGYPTPGDMLKHIDADLDNALKQWAGRPTLPPPETLPPIGGRVEER
jgi:AbiV family abortive infection protein